MKKRDNRLLKTGVFLKHLKFTTTLILLIWFGFRDANGATPLLTDFKILFDWDTDGYSQDALPVYSDNDEIRSNPNIFEFAYVINTSPKVKITIDTDCNDEFILLIYGKAVQGNGFDICFADYNYTHSTGEFYFNVPIPGYITKFNFKWEWAVTAIPSCGTPSNFSSNSFVKTTEQHLYVILDEPTAPMDPPWASALNYACVWASGQSTVTSIISSLTNNLYSSGVEYDGGTHYTSGSYTNLDLTSLLNDLNNPSGMYMDCRDFANFLHVLSNALGVNGGYYIIYHKDTNYPYYYIPFYYNYLLPANKPSKIRGYWNFHQVGWYSSKVADASTQIDNDPDPTSSPHNWELAVGNMTITQYYDKLSEDDLKSGATGICSPH